jgi:parallel beta-helix repeat protein
MIVLTFCSLAMLGLLVTSSSDRNDASDRESPTAAKTLALTDHDPILIDGNAGFTNESGVVWGSGTASDPYIIADWNISAFPYNGIAILHSDVHFIIMNCHICDGSTVYVGIYLWDCSNGTLYGNNCSDNMNGISLQSSSNNTLSNNNCSNGFFHGIYLDSSNNNTLRNNNCSLNTEWGIYLVSSSNNTLSNNNCSSNGYDGNMLDSSSNFNTLVSNRGFWNVYNGIDVVSSRDNILVSNNWSSNGFDGAYIGYSTNNTLDSNNCSSNNRWGIQMGHSSGNVMLRNQLCDNMGPGMYIHSTSSFNILFNNTFIGNNGAGSTYDSSHVQAYDDGTSNWWNNTEGYGNYWSDWTTPDVVLPYGIVDVPYDIAGSAGAKDYFPLTTPQAPIPEFGMMPFMVMILLTAVVLTIGARRRKTD